MGSYIKNDKQLTAALEDFFERISSRCSKTNDEYLADVTAALSDQSASFYANLPVSSYGVLEKPYKYNLPFTVRPDVIQYQIFQRLDARREAAIHAYKDTNMSDFKPSKYAKAILSPHWLATRYGIIEGNEGKVIILGKRHPNLMARDALKHAAQTTSDTIYDKILESIEWYIAIDTSLLEINKRLCRIYFKDNNSCITQLEETFKRFDPYAPQFNPKFDFRFKEAKLTETTIQSLEG